MIKYLPFCCLFFPSALVYAGLNPDFYPAKAVVSCGPVDVYFGCTSPQNPSYLKWDFGDGESSGIINPMHHYSRPGVYTVKLYVESANAKDSVSKVGFVSILARPFAQFVEDSSGPLIPLRRKFKDRSTAYSDSLISFTWGVDQSWVPGKKEFISIFPDSGIYRIHLTVTNNLGCMDSAGIWIHINERRDPNSNALSESSEAPLPLYPNPVTGERLFIKINPGLYHLHIEDLDGKTYIEKNSLSDGSLCLDVSSLPDGLYFLTLLYNSEIRRIRFVKDHVAY